MKKLILALFAATVLSNAALSAAKDPATCVTKEAFKHEVASVTVAIYEVPKDKIDKFLLNLNKQTTHPIVADEMFVGALTDGKIGMIMFNEGCAIAETAAGDTSKVMHLFFKKMDSEDILAKIGTSL